MRILLTICSFTALLITGGSLLGQESIPDSAYIKPFDKTNLMEIYPGIFNTRFNFSDPKQRKSDYSLIVNSNGYTGTYLNYKYISLKYSWAMPGTSLDKNAKLNTTSLSFRFTGRYTIVHPFYDLYNGLLIPQKGRGRKYEAFRGIQVVDAGTDIYYFNNSKRYSPKSAIFSSELQTKSAGSFFAMTTPLWQKIKWKSPSPQLLSDPDTYSLLSSDPQWFSLITCIGYTYNQVFQKGKWNIAPAFMLGAGGLRELNTGYKIMKAATKVEAWINTGYSGNNYYAYLNASWTNEKTNLFIANMHRINSDFSFTLGYRFHNFKKKIMWLV